MRSRPALALVVTVLVLAALPLAAAKRPATEQAKIDRLLSEISLSDASFLRNGAAYDGGKAASHLKMKLFWAGARVQTARDFIRGICTHSETSGKTYDVRFRDGSQRPLADWLSERLDAFEKKR